jgi:hypothetical protein
VLNNNNYTSLIFTVAAVLGIGWPLFAIWRGVRKEDARIRAVAGGQLQHKMLAADFTILIMADSLGISESALDAYFTGRKAIPKMLTLAINQILDERDRDRQMQRNLRVLWASPASPADAMPREKAKLRLISGGRAALRQEIPASDPWIGPAA